MLHSKNKLNDVNKLHDPVSVAQHLQIPSRIGFLNGSLRVAMPEPVQFNLFVLPGVVSRIRGSTMSSSTQSKGFTLLEVLVTLVILAIALLALAGLMATTVRNNSYGGVMTEATTVAQDKLEEFKGVAWVSLLPTTSGPSTDQRKSSTGINFTRTWTIVENGNLKTITLTVSWTDRITHSIRILSAVSR